MIANYHFYSHQNFNYEGDSNLYFFFSDKQLFCAGTAANRKPLANVFRHKSSFYHLCTSNGLMINHLSPQTID